MAPHGNVLRRSPLQLQRVSLTARTDSRNFSARASDREPPPSEGILGLVKGAVRSVQNAVQGLVGGNKLARGEQQQQREMDRLPGGMPGGLVGWAMGGLMKSAIKLVSKQLEAAAKESDLVMQEVTQRLRSSSKLRRRLGENIVVGNPTSQSSSSVSINGRSTQRIMLVLPVQGSSGIRAQAQVQYSNMQKEGPLYDITVFLPDGQMKLGDESDDDDFPGGRTIDVEFKDVK
ncbi:MAG: hypothetical protein WDW36_002260 [Sanguina aurantia]